MCSLQTGTYLQVQVLPRQWMVGPSSDSRLRLGETPAGASSAVNYSQRREGEANGPPGQRPDGVSRGGPSWTELVRPAHQAVVAFAGAGMINRAEPRARGHSREPIHLDPEPDTERNAGTASNAAGTGCGRSRSDEAGFHPYWGKPALRHDQRGGGGNEVDGRMTFCHDARKSRYIGGHWPNHVRASALLDQFLRLDQGAGRESAEISLADGKADSACL